MATLDSKERKLYEKARLAEIEAHKQHDTNRWILADKETGETIIDNLFLQEAEDYVENALKDT